RSSAHEVAHVANGDMVTMTLLQGVLNTFVIAASRALAWVVARATSQNSEEGSFSPVVYFVTSLVAQIALGLLATIIVMSFSRRREFRADAGAATLVGAAPMMAALERLKGDEPAELPDAVRAFGIRGGGSWMAWFSSHPPLEARIEALAVIARR
ncbi:MAG: M48 family metalloprotease, partial [Myxococcales bacterium]|nr:M48 family metalloprotease [Myxococcales bacterium]